MSQVCNLVYHQMIDGKTPPQVAEVDVLLSDPRDKDEMIQRQNAEAMKALGAMGSLGLTPPPRGRKKTPA